MGNRFDRDTGVRAVGPADAGPGVYEGSIDRGWWIVRGPNGGYVAALLLRALAAEVPAERAPRSLTVHYTAPPAEGPVRVHTRVERIGRSLTTVSGRMVQGDRLLALALGAFSIARPGPCFGHVRMPEAPQPETCPSFPSGIPMHDRYEYRWALGSPPDRMAPGPLDRRMAPQGPGPLDHRMAPEAPGPLDRRMAPEAPGPLDHRTGGEEALCGGWIRLAEPRIADAPLVAAYTDAWPPACFSWAPSREAIGPVPTVDLTIHFRSELPRPGARPEDWCLAVFRSRLAAGGFVEEDGEVWSRDGVLLAQSRQLAVMG